MKKIIYILLGLALAAVVAIAALVSLIDPNQFKPQLAEQVRKSTGRELVIQGDIGWRFWPSLASPSSRWRCATPPVSPSPTWCASRAGRPRWACCRCSPTGLRSAR